MASPNTEAPSGQRIGCFKYKGVRKRKWGKWVSEIRLPNSRERIWLGSHDSAEKAARAFDAALYCLRGDRANFNFPDTPLHIHLAAPHQSLTPQEIQVVAARFANHQHHAPPHEESPSASLTETASTSCTSSSSLYDIDGTLQQLDHGDPMAIDWSFLNLLDSNVVASDSDYGLYSGLENIHSAEFEFYPISPVVPFQDEADENETHDAFYHQSFLWNFEYGCL